MSNPQIENSYSDMDPNRKMETSGSWALRRTRKKQLCFAWPIASISLVGLLCLGNNQLFIVVCLLCLLFSYYRVFLPVSPPLPWLLPLFLWILFLLTLQDGSEIIIANIITYCAPVSIQSVTHISIYIYNPHTKWMRQCCPILQVCLQRGTEKLSNLPKVIQWQSGSRVQALNHFTILAFHLDLRGKKLKNTERGARTLWDLRLCPFSLS